MSRPRPGQPAYAPYRPVKAKKGSAVKWLIISALGLLATSGIIFVVLLTISAMNRTLVAFDDVPGAMDDQALDVLARELNMNNETEVQIKVPITFEDALAYLDFRPEETFLEPYDQKRKRLTCEWLFGRMIDEEFRREIAQSLAEAYHATTSSFDRELQLAVMRAFQRWGDPDFVHMMISSRANDKIVPTMLELAERYPTVHGTEVASTFLKGKYGDIAERIVKNSAEKNAKLLVPYLDSRDVSVSDRVNRIFDDWGVNVDDVRLEYYLSRAAGGDAGAWEMVANIPKTEANQKTVVDALRRYKRDRGGVNSWLDACWEWGDKSILGAVQTVYVSGWRFDKQKAMRIMVKYPDQSSVDVLVNALLNSWATESDEISRALFQLEKSGIEIDFAESVHKPLLQHYNDFGLFQKPAMKNLLETTNFDYNLLVDQCLKDLQSSGKSNQAFQTLGRMRVIEDRRFEVAQAIQETIEAGGIPGFHTDECFLHWATPENTYLYDLINDDTFGGDTWRKALRIALKGDDHIQKLIVPVARAMGDFHKGDEIIDVLIEQGDAAEDLMIFMLKSDNPKELVGACRVLQVIGTQKCLPELQRVYNTAKRIRHEEVYNASQMAGQIVTDKVERQNQGSGDNPFGESDDGDNESGDG